MYIRFSRRLRLTRKSILQSEYIHCISQTIWGLQAGHRKFVSDIMHLHDEQGFAERDPYSKRINRVPKHPIGIHERWSGDGHDKLYKIGYPI